MRKKKKIETVKVLKFCAFIWSFSSDIMAVKGLTNCVKNVRILTFVETPCRETNISLDRMVETIVTLHQ